MKLYSGNVGKLSQIRFLKENGIGRLVVVTEWRPPIEAVPWILDNGAFGAWRKGERFPDRAFLRTLERVPRSAPPDFGVCPDIVEGGTDSLVFSYVWRGRLNVLGYEWIPWVLAVQDGIEEETIRRQLEIWRGVWAGLFVGGTLTWKYKTAETWVKLAHEFGLLCHIGRVGKLEDLLWADRIGADSVDSISWARNDSHERIVLAYLRQTRITEAVKS